LASPIRQDDVASIRNGDSPNAEVESVARAIAIAVVEYHPRGMIAAGLATGFAAGLAGGVATDFSAGLAGGCQRGSDQK
jgi:hypothetical protein